MRIVIVAVASILLVGSAVAQDDALAAAKAECAELSKEIDAAFKAHREAFAKVRESDEYQETLAKYRESRDAEALEKLRAFSRSVPRPDYATWAPKFALGAIKNSGRDAAVPYLTWLISQPRKRRVDAHFETSRVGQGQIQLSLFAHAIAGPIVNGLVAFHGFVLRLRATKAPADRHDRELPVLAMHEGLDQEPVLASDELVSNE